MSSVPNLERVVLEIFGGCNYSCQMCPQSSPGRDSEFIRKMSLEMFEDILDQITPRYGKPVINLEGSGEPTLLPNLPQYIEACTKRGLQSYMYCNGSMFFGDRMRASIDAGLSFIRFSCIGYNAEKYKEWMSKDNFELIRNNAIETRKYVERVGSNCTVASYHLILDNSQIEFETNEYRKNFIDYTGTIGYIWKMHNWSGNYQPIYFRNSGDRKTCGRPFAPDLTVRAGGLNGELGAVTPCCQTLGPPNEKKSVLGHFSNQTLEEIWNGQPYQKLRAAHASGDFDSIDYCKNCDFLYQNEEVLVWSNDPKASINKMLGTNFLLDQVNHFID